MLKGFMRFLLVVGVLYLVIELASFLVTGEFITSWIFPTAMIIAGAILFWIDEHILSQLDS